MATTVSSICPDNPSDAIKILAVIVEHAGGNFVGVLEAMPEHNLPTYLMFDHPKHHSTLALRLDESFGTEAILRRPAECDEKCKDPR